MLLVHKSMLAPCIHRLHACIALGRYGARYGAGVSVRACSAGGRAATHSRRNEWTSWACAGVATTPVPMAQTGSYATTTRDQSCT